MKHKFLVTRHKQTRLTPLQKVEIRAAINARRYLTTSALAKRFNVTTTTIYRIGRGQQ